MTDPQSYQQKLEAILQAFRDEIDDQPGETTDVAWIEIRKRHDQGQAEALAAITQLNLEAIGPDTPYPAFKGDTSVLTLEALDFFVQQAAFDYKFHGAQNRLRAELRTIMTEGKE